MNRPKQHLGELATIQDVVSYIEAHLRERGKRDDEDIAASIVGLEVNDQIEAWCQEDPDLDAIISMCWDLEWSNSADLAADWRELEAHFIRLKKRYSV